jgi:hypothetical protein
MDDRSVVEIFWALAVLSFPVCILIFTIIFKKEIGRLLERIGCRNLIEEKYRTTSKNDEFITDKIGRIDAKISSIDDDSRSQKKENYQKIDNDFIFVKVCQNQNSGDHFIMIGENTDDKATMINPNGEIKTLELKLFNNFAQVTINELIDKNLVNNKQITCYFNYIENDANNFLDEYDSEIEGNRPSLTPRGEEPEYIKNYRNIMRNPDTWPSRMLKIIKNEKVITRRELQKIIVTKYNYATSDTNGSFHASLRLLLVDDLIIVEGIGDNKIIKIKNY